MWWKLSALAAATIVAITLIIPIRSRAVKYDIVPGEGSPPPSGFSLRQMVENMYLTPGTVILIAIVLSVAGAIAFRIIRAA
ncbi:hypothetical protein [Sphingosinicella sp.]|uniref:hypothetical protein n=1 Tax=Sphingosinicella sp. TaxID=1917971 RepID=UPI004037806D